MFIANNISSKLDYLFGDNLLIIQFALIFPVLIFIFLNYMDDLLFYIILFLFFVAFLTPYIISFFVSIFSFLVYEVIRHFFNVEKIKFKYFFITSLMVIFIFQVITFFIYYF